MRKAKTFKARYSDAALKKMTYDELVQNMTDAQIAFCTEYAACNNPKIAAARAGYVVKDKGYNAAARLLEVPECRDLIRWFKLKAADDAVVSARDILDMLTRLSFYDVSDYVDIVSNTLVIKDLAYTDTQVIQSIEQGRNGIKIKFADRLKALEQLAEYIPGTPATERLALESKKYDILREKLELEKARAGVGLEAEDDGFIAAIESAASGLKLSDFDDMEAAEVLEMEDVNG